MAFETVRFLSMFLMISSSIEAEVLTKKAYFPAVRPDEAASKRILLKSFSSPSELACSQKCLRHDQCNFKKYNPNTKQCELLSQVIKNDLNNNAEVTKKEYFCPNKHLSCKPILCNGCGENCKCENDNGKHRCNCTGQGVFQSCKDALESNGFQTAVYQILPLIFQNPINVECIKDETGKSFAVFHHNNEDSTTVKGYEIPTSYKFKFVYSFDMNTLISLISLSSHCQQYTKARCIDSLFYNPTWRKWYSWLNDRNGNKLDFWGGGPSNGRGCACGITKSCVVKTLKCNCDKNDGTWRSDEGNMVKKEVLPIASITVGDTGQSLEKFIYEIGPMLCVI